MSELDLKDSVIKNARALVYKIKNNKKMFLLTFEPGGFYTIPGGCKELGDKDIVCTIRRELKEELSLGALDYDIVEIEIQKKYKNLYSDPSSERFNLDTLTSIFIVKVIGKKAINCGCEIKDVQWFEEVEVYNKLNTEHMREIFRSGIQELNSKQDT